MNGKITQTLATHNQTFMEILRMLHDQYKRIEQLENEVRRLRGQ